MNTSAFDPMRLRNAFGGFTTGVCVLGTRDGDGNPIGITLNSFTSVSLDPALLLVSLGHFLRSHDALLAASGFAISILADHQEEVSARFSKRDGLKWQDFPAQEGQAGGLIVPNALASFDCRHHNSLPAGDHTLLLGEILSVQHDPSLKPLVFQGGHYRRLAA